MTVKQRIHKNKIDYNSFEYYRNYKRRTKDYEDKQITQALHTKILETFAKVVMRKIVFEMYKFHFPGLGLFYLTKRKIKIIKKQNGEIDTTSFINWKETNKVRELTGDNTKKVVFLNDHTNGYIYSLKWYKRSFVFVNKTFYSFIASRKFRIFISKSIKESDKPLNAYML